ncbi:hypothetical protein Q0M19_14235, partial [Staphylococcus aureus]|nr:hypothetical protein [Staphylococcus aureus]
MQQQIAALDARYARRTDARHLSTDMFIKFPKIRWRRYILGEIVIHPHPSCPLITLPTHQRFVDPPHMLSTSCQS